MILLLMLFSSLQTFAQFSRQDFRKLNALTGVWQMPQPPGLLYEIWEQASDTLLLGRSFSVRNGDTIPQETVRLSWSLGRITYTPTVAGQNGGLPVSFTLKSISDSGFLFENPAHDFPQLIRYMPSENILFAIVSGQTAKGYRANGYTYTRVPKPVVADPMGYFRGRWRLRAWLSGKGTNTPPDINATWFVSGILENVTCLSGQVQLAGGKLFTSELIAFDPAKRTFTCAPLPRPTAVTSASRPKAGREMASPGLARNLSGAPL
jgi:hypothetical protein